jgi:putative oxidoreductase
MSKTWSPWAPLPLRLVIGFSFIYHGWPKLFTSAGHSYFVANLQGIGVPAPELAGWAVAAVEVFGGLALLVGAFTTVVAGLLIIHQIVALLTVHLAAGFNFVHVTGMTAAGPQFGLPGYEVNLLFIAGLLALLLGGPGAASVDAARTRPAGAL